MAACMLWWLVLSGALSLPTPTREKRAFSGCVMGMLNAEGSWNRKGPVSIKRGLFSLLAFFHHTTLSQLRKTRLMDMIASVSNGKTTVPTVLVGPDQGADEKDQEVLSSSGGPGNGRREH